MKWFIFAAILATGVAVWTYRHSASPGPEPAKPAATSESGSSPGLPLPSVLSQETLETLRQLAQDLDPQVQWAALESLYRMKDPSADGLLAQVFESESSPALKKNLLEMLGRARDRKALPLCLKALRDMDGEVRSTALQTIRSVGDPGILPQLQAILPRLDYDVQSEALKVMDALRAVERERRKQSKPQP